MTPARWARLQEIFDEALIVNSADRAAYIASACGSDFSLREQVLALVFASSAADAGFEERIDRAVSASARDSLELASGETIGPYRILNVMGRGGMGTVYLAERADEQYQQRVAVKLMTRASASGTTAARFRAERQILANLTHPNISRLLDGGTTSGGLPYFVMEYIEGQPIDEYCDRLKLAVSARLELFRTVCGAVHYAHQNLVVHRDLKPSNILVTADGTVKLLDFGIAKLLRPEAAAHTVAMTQAIRLMTPEHASPEQIRGESITTAADVYSLGVLLYQLLCGRTPHYARRAGPGELERSILEHMPVQPSAAVMAKPAEREDERTRTSAAIAGERSTTPERLRHELAGDLDTIVLVALRKEPDRRYGSAQALADDVGRHLRNLPVTAQADSLAYRVRKFVRRHRLGLGAGVTMIAAVIGLTTVYTVRLASERDRAEAEATKSRMVAEFLTGIFQQADPAQAQGAQMTALELLDQGARDIDTRLTDQPLVRADLLHAIGFSYMSLGEYDRAVTLIGRTLALKSAAHLENTREYAKAAYDMAGLKRFQSKYPEAEELYRRALAIQERLFDGPHGDTALTLTHLAILYYEMQRFQESVDLQMKALAMTRAAFGERHTETANRLSNLALPLQELNRHAEAERALKEAVEIQVGTLGPRHPDSLAYRYNLALLLRNTGRYGESEREMRDVLETRLAVLGPTHPRVTTSMSALGTVLTTLGKFDEAQQVLTQALEVQTAKLGPGHFRVGNATRNLGTLALARGRFPEAEQLFRRAYENELAIYGESADVLHRTNALIAAAMLHQDKAKEAEPLLERSYAALLASSGAGSDAITRTLEVLAELRVGQDRLDEGAALYQQAVKNYESVGGPDHPLLADPLVGLADIALRRREPAEAEALCRRTLAILQPRFPPDYWRTALASAVLGRALLASGKRDAAEPLIRSGYETLRQSFGDADPRTRRARVALEELRSRRAVVQARLSSSYNHAFARRNSRSSVEVEIPSTSHVSS